MAYCKSYMCDEKITVISPFDDWLRTPGIPAVFQYWSSSYLCMYFCPFDQLLRIDLCDIYDDATVDVKLSFDNEKRIIGVSEILCKIRNRWPLWWTKPVSVNDREGGMSLYKANEAIELDFSIQLAVNIFFGSAYTFL